ncbi:MAG: GDP-L-fucose synthase, partial [Nitrospirota bacterium]
SAVCRELTRRGYANVVTRTSSDLDLTRQADVEDFFSHERPEYVFLAAAKVGGILANSTYPADFIYTNLSIAANVIHAAYKAGVKKLLNLGSSCIYPKFAPQPLKEEYLLGGPLEPTNEAYAIAKISAIKLCKFYNQQYGTDFISVMPTNLYGPGDNFDLQNSHVIPGLMRKFHEAKANRADEVVIWGTGTPRREFLYVDDLAKGCVFLMENKSAADIGEFVNIGTGEDVTINQLAELLKKITGFNGRITYDRSKPDGTPRKLLDVSLLNSLGWKYGTALESGLEYTYEWYKSSGAALR